MLITHWLNVLRARTDSARVREDLIRRHAARRHGVKHFGDVFAPWFGRRLQPVMVTPTTRRVRQLRVRQRLG